MKKASFQVSFFVFILNLSVLTGPMMAKKLEITGEFNDGGKMPRTERVKVDVFEGEQRVGFGNDSKQLRFVRFTARPTDAATRVVLKFSTTSPGDWMVDPLDMEIDTSDAVHFGTVLVKHRPSELNAELMKVESATAAELPEAKEALAKAESLLRGSVERLRWARAQNGLLKLENKSRLERYTAFDKAVSAVDRDRLSSSGRLALSQEEFDLFTAAVVPTTADAGNAEKIGAAIFSVESPAIAGKTPEEKFREIAKDAAAATGVPATLVAPNGDVAEPIKNLGKTLKRKF